MEIRNRIKELRYLPAKQLKPSKYNWRAHSQYQKNVLQGVLSEIGYAGALIAYMDDEGEYRLIDGHLRAETTPDMDVPVLLLDVNENEARYLLLTHDPIAGLAEQDDDALNRLLEETKVENVSVRNFLDEMRPDSVETHFVKIDTESELNMAWCLIGVPMESWGETYRLVQGAEQIPGAVIHTSVT